LQSKAYKARNRAIYKNYTKTRAIKKEDASSFYTSKIASTGHTSSHAPQSMQASSSITKGSPSSMQSTGHSSAHAPHAMHSSVIRLAIIFLLVYEISPIVYDLSYKYKMVFWKFYRCRTCILHAV